MFFYGYRAFMGSHPEIPLFFVFLFAISALLSIEFRSGIDIAIISV